MSDESDATGAALAGALTAPKRVRGDAGEVEMPSLTEIIAADKYQRTIDAARTRRGRGVRFTKFVPPGAV